MKYLDYPNYKKINRKELNPMTIILVAGGNKLTRWFENKINKYPYKPAFTHALIHIEDGACCNVGFTTTNDDIEDIIKDGVYYLGIDLADLTPSQIERGQALCYKKIGSKKDKFKIYDVLGFVSFGLRKLGIKVKGSEKRDFCSDQVVDIFSAIEHPLFKGVLGELTSPCDLYNLVKDYEFARIRQIV